MTPKDPAPVATAASTPPTPPAPTATPPSAAPSGEPLTWLRTDRSLTDPWLAEALRHLPPERTQQDPQTPSWQSRLRDAVLAAADQALAADTADAALRSARAAQRPPLAATAPEAGDKGLASTQRAAMTAIPKPATGSRLVQKGGRVGWTAGGRWLVWAGLCAALIAAAGVLWLRRGP